MISSKISSRCQYFPTCGGCDFLDLEEKDYRKIKQKEIDELYPSAEWVWVGAQSRRKIILQIGRKNEVGFFQKKSTQIIEIEKCFVAEEKISAAIFLIKNFLKNQEQNLFTHAAITLFDSGLDVVFNFNKEPSFTQIQKIISFAKEQNFNISYRVRNQLTPIFLCHKNQIFYTDFKIDLGSDIFIQATKSGLEAIIYNIREFIGKTTKDLRIVDIYAGFGAYSFAVQDLAKLVFAFEGDQKMVDLINKNAAANNLSHKITAEVCDLFSNPISFKELKQFDLAIINPPRNGASPQILEISKSALKNVIYVSCNPQSFARDSNIMIDSGFKITKLVALDQFYSTKHLELIAIFQK